MNSIETLNRRAWESQDAVERYGNDSGRGGWTDPGERAVVARLAAEMAGKRILDIGVGGGRTVPLLTAISEDYLGVDYTERLLESCRARYPEQRFEFADARELKDIPDASVDWAVFSYNGIDATSFEDRPKVFAAAHRVLKPGGVLLFSTHNRASPACGEKPWSWFHFTFNPLRLAVRGSRLAIGLAQDLPNYVRNRRHNRHHDGWSVMVAASHHFSMVITYIDLDLQKRLLADTGFAVEAVYGSEGEQALAPGAESPDIWWFHLVARKRR